MLFLFYGFSRRSTDRTLAQRIPSQWDLWFSKWSAYGVLWPRSLSTILFWVYRKPYRARSKPSAVIVLSIITQALLTGRVSCLKSEMGKSPGEVNNHVPPEAAPPPPLYAHHALAHAYTPVHRGWGRRRRHPSHFSSANSPLNLLSQRSVFDDFLFCTTLCSFCTFFSVCFSDALVLLSPSMVVVINSLQGRGAGSCWERSTFSLVSLSLTVLRQIPST